MKTKKIIGLFALIALFLVISLSGCNWLFEHEVPIKIINYDSWGIEVYYRESGDTTWTALSSYVSSGGGTATVDLPGPGTYDFRVIDWITSGTYISDIAYSETVENLDLSGGYDYILSVSSSGTISFY